QGRPDQPALTGCRQLNVGLASDSDDDNISWIEIASVAHLLHASIALDNETAAILGRDRQHKLSVCPLDRRSGRIRLRSFAYHHKSPAGQHPLFLDETEDTG